MRLLAYAAPIMLLRATSRSRRNRYIVRIDGEVVGTIAVGEVKCYDVQPGAHTVQLRQWWAGSPVLQVCATSGEAVRLTCSARDDDTLGAVQALETLVRPLSWIELWQVQEVDTRGPWDNPLQPGE
jgi:hypothetical protein